MFDLSTDLATVTQHSGSRHSRKGGSGISWTTSSYTQYSDSSSSAPNSVSTT